MDNSTPRKPEKNTRFPNGYRYSDAFLQKATKWIVAMIFIGPAIGIVISIIGSTLYSEDIPLWETALPLGISIAGIAIPLFVAAWLGGMAVHRFGGWAGLVIILGVGGNVAGQVVPSGLWFWIGLATILLGYLWLSYLGFKAKVPMWIQLPIFNSPRLYLFRGKKKPSAKTK